MAAGSRLGLDQSLGHESTQQVAEIVGDSLWRRVEFGHERRENLLHVANVFRSNVRASDVIGRFGGEEFGMILRGGSPEGAAVLAAKLRRVLSEQAATTAEGIIIPLYVSIGWASYPTDGSTAGELAHYAVRAMRKEKAEKA